jgi:concentrative nucleoside transporter, CNT family
MSQEPPAISRSHTEPIVDIAPDSQVPVTHDEISPYTADEKQRGSSTSLAKERPIADAAALDAKEEADIEANRKKQASIWRKIRPFFLTALILLILGWWISATVLPATRHRWCVPSTQSCGVPLTYVDRFRIVQTVWAWFFIM